MKITIKNVPPYDGAYELDASAMTNREISTIKRISGYTPLEWEEAGNRGDSDLIVAFAVVALTRSGRFLPRVNEDVLWDAELGAIDVDTSDEEEEDAQASPPPSDPDGSLKPSGSAGNDESASPPASLPRPTGVPSSPTSAISDPEISERSRLTS